MIIQGGSGELASHLIGHIPKALLHPLFQVGESVPAPVLSVVATLSGLRALALDTGTSVLLAQCILANFFVGLESLALLLCMVQHQVGAIDVTYPAFATAQCTAGHGGLDYCIPGGQSVYPAPPHPLSTLPPSVLVLAASQQALFHQFLPRCMSKLRLQHWDHLAGSGPFRARTSSRWSHPSPASRSPGAHCTRASER